MNSQVPGEPVSLAGCQEDQSMPMNTEAAEDNIFHVMTLKLLRISPGKGCKPKKGRQSAPMLPTATI